MPSLTHQWLVLWVARKMAQDGFTVTNVDGPVPQGGALGPVRASPNIGEARPDVVGVTREGRVALGEAKTGDDVFNEHTVGQLLAFASVTSRPGGPARLYVGVPQSAVRDLDRALRVAGLLASPAVIRLHIPDCMLEGEGADDDG
jgi:hypothetical protein